MVAAPKKSKGIYSFGLGVNEGIARFKKKWGGVPSSNMNPGKSLRRKRASFPGSGPWLHDYDLAEKITGS